ncbi:hypothetical protein COCSUDRAFT_33320 [Coccomyxa subellipsoidea C-169]|uniref:Uncharacterized protein n=1 Tax=Coccomyxa subellipsoidea (strain C-169) TaxID=574566 RepID=I0YVZ7_COCSC|nr:hypothetical protein COCSUDRAFT_33320 [Coccomyxa subellipsoidea C-169]EIE22566.1 hypothetical protein COCSUDRAFT_33320 [Coccomyxa subellipsoidea C-169]|eukprot:XP_005647110.1 hypothetical protein COCSUDRAFT_33320 [Coccomyxa subellipsoidea C-169]
MADAYEECLDNEAIGAAQRCCSIHAKLALKHPRFWEHTKLAAPSDRSAKATVSFLEWVPIRPRCIFQELSCLERLHTQYTSVRMRTHGMHYVHHCDMQC